jgi:galactokinase
MGGGLSSSAALEVALLKAINELFDLNLNEIEIAKLGQRVENEFVGAHVGIMDQMAASLGRLGEALFIDTRDLTFRRLPLPPEQIRLLVINSGVVHNHALGDYNQRRAECEQACRLLGLRELRDFKMDGTNSLQRLRTLPDVLQKRARHVVTENNRVLEAVKALEKQNLTRLGELFSASHVSMRDDYQVSIPEIDTLVEISESFPEIFGARLTGGGFGGSIVALVDGKTSTASIDAMSSEIIARYAAQTGRRATVLGHC